MNLKEAADRMAMNYSVTVGRFGGNESLFCRFLKKFPGDESAQRLQEAVAAKSWEDIEMNAHTLKGVAANLGLEEVREKSDALVQAVRMEQYGQIEDLYEQWEKSYQGAVAIIEMIE